MWHPTTTSVIMIIKVLQLNCQERKQTTMDILNRRDADLILLQELHLVKATKRPSNDPRWISIYCDQGNGKIRAASYVRRHSKMAGMITKLDYTNKDLAAIEVGNIKFINIYNQKVYSKIQEALKYFMEIHENISIENTIMAGDFNAHHTYWHGNARTDKTGRDLVKWLSENEMTLCSTKNVITRELGGRESVIDLVFASLDVSANIEESPGIGSIGP
jgi:endonuclease/exonuclease/phosphatase (EEP) superfamily protein YafD